MIGFSPGRFPSPLRYPGGKGKIANFFKLLLLENDLVGVDYVEPYAGGAGVALSLLFEDYVDRIHINDINPGVHAFWDAALNRTDDLCLLVAKIPTTIDEWHRQRAVQKDPEAEPLDLALSTFFLNRVNRSGIISGGIIGGQEQAGTWKLDARFNRDDLINRIRKVGRFRSRITLTRLDAAEMLSDWCVPAHAPALVYLDPPYYVKGEGLYDNFYNHLDHEKIARLVALLPHPWVVSYDAAPQISQLYAKESGINYSLSYSAQDRYRGSELMYFSPGLTIPDVLPTKVTTARLTTRLA